MPYLQLWYYVVEIFLLLSFIIFNIYQTQLFLKNDFKVTVDLKTKEFTN